MRDMFYGFNIVDILNDIWLKKDKKGGSGMGY